jgi:hypothetical protein
MSNDLRKHAKSIADSSGFPLQIRIASIVNSMPGWQVLVEEHPWRSEETNLSGFLDIVIENGEIRTDKFYAMLIECKRVRQTAWVFLIPKPTPKKRSHARLWDSKYADSKWERFGWGDWQIEPASYESKFCAIPGQEQGRRNILERTASELIDATEAFAFQEKELKERQASPQFRFIRIYIPVIVTTAELIISYFEPGDISLKDGSLPSNAVFETVTSVRFRKSLTARLPLHQQSIKEAHENTERTIFIVNAENFQEFLRDFSIRGM